MDAMALGRPTHLGSEWCVESSQIGAPILWQVAGVFLLACLQQGLQRAQNKGESKQNREMVSYRKVQLWPGNRGDGDPRVAWQHSACLYIT